VNAKKKKIVKWNFSNFEISFFFNLGKIHCTEIFTIFPVSSSMGNKDDFRKKTYKVTGLVFKINAICVKKSSLFLYMQQNSATLIYDLKSMRGTVES